MPKTGFGWYNIAEPNEFLVITGANVEDVKIVKEAIVLPWQKVKSIPLKQPTILW